MARIVPPTQENIETVARALRDGAVVGMPTETVYGLAADVFQVAAVARVFEAKERPSFDPLIVHVAPAGAPFAALVRMKLIESASIPLTVQEELERLMETFWPGPLTLILPKHERVPDLVTSGLATVGIRMPAHPVAQALIQATRAPLAAPSANRFGRISPTTAGDVREELGDRIEWILDGGPCTVGVESTIVGWEASGWRLFRPGGTPLEEIERVLGRSVMRTSSQPSEAAVAAPGMLESHYAPAKSLSLLPKRISALSDEELRKILISNCPGVLLMQGDAGEAEGRLKRLFGPQAQARSLSLTGALPEAAAALFATLRELDSSSCDALYAEPCASDRGLGYAITDRLTRASRR